jgi:hypothetical protein
MEPSTLKEQTYSLKKRTASGKTILLFGLKEERKKYYPNAVDVHVQLVEYAT